MNVTNKVIGNQAETTSAAKKRKNDFRNMNGDVLQTMNVFPTTIENLRGRMDSSNDGVSVAAGSNGNNDSNVFLALTSGRGLARTEIGFASIDIDRPTLKVCQISDDTWYTGLLTKLNILQPIKIIVPHTIYDARRDTPDAKLLKSIRDQFPRFNILKIPRRHFNNDEGMEYLQKYCLNRYQHIKQSTETKYYAVSAVAALLKYLQYFHCVKFLDQSLQVEVETKYAHMLIDVKTSYRLELLSSTTNAVKDRKTSLFDLLNLCSTAIGKRTLRAKILEPLCDVSDITMIHDCINEIINHPNKTYLIAEVQDVLGQYYAVDRLSKLTLVVPQDDNIRAAEILINRTLQLRNCLQNIPKLRQTIVELQSKIFREIFVGLEDARYEYMLDLINEQINENVSLLGDQQLQRINCVKSEINDLLDLTRSLYYTLKTEINNETEEVSAKYGLPFKLMHNISKGYHLQLTVPAGTNINDFSTDLKVLQMKRSNCLLTTSNLTKLNIRMKGVVEEVTVQTNIILTILIQNIVKELDVIYDLSGFVAMLDIIFSLAKVSMTGGYVCPKFSNETRIVDGLHPLLEFNIEHKLGIPNNAIATPDFNFYIITGPNMGGKTVYIKMIAILQIMAQLGCFVPATSAEFRITDRIFTRIGFNDSIEEGASSFQLEMSELDYMLQNVTPNSILIIDEICRSTKPAEGKYLAWKICEQLICLRGIANNGEYFTDLNQDEQGDRSTVTDCSIVKTPVIKDITAPFIFVTTHFFNLTRLPEYYFNAFNLNISAEESFKGENRFIKYDYKIKEGVTTLVSYGLALAKTVRFPPSIVPAAEEIFKTVSENMEQEYDEVNKKRRPSELSVAISSKLTKEQMAILDDTSSVVLTHHSKSNPKTTLPNIYEAENIEPSNATRVTSVISIDVDQQKIDRMLYNLYSDIASTIHCAKTVTPENAIPDPMPGILKSLGHFVNNHKGGFIDAIMEYIESSNSSTMDSQTVHANTKSILRIQDQQDQLDTTPQANHNQPDRPSPLSNDCQSNKSIPVNTNMMTESERTHFNYLAEHVDNDILQIPQRNLQHSCTDQNNTEYIADHLDLQLDGNYFDRDIRVPLKDLPLDSNNSQQFVQFNLNNSQQPFELNLNNSQFSGLFRNTPMDSASVGAHIPSAYDVITEENDLYYFAQANNDAPIANFENVFPPLALGQSGSNKSNRAVYSFDAMQVNDYRTHGFEAGLSQRNYFSQNLSEIILNATPSQDLSSNEVYLNVSDHRECGLSPKMADIPYRQCLSERNNIATPSTSHFFDSDVFTNLILPLTKRPQQASSTGRLSLDTNERESRCNSAFVFHSNQYAGRNDRSRESVANISTTTRIPELQSRLFESSPTGKRPCSILEQQQISKKQSLHPPPYSKSVKSLGIKRPKLTYDKSKINGSKMLNYTWEPSTLQEIKKTTEEATKHYSEPINNHHGVAGLANLADRKEDSTELRIAGNQSQTNATKTTSLHASKDHREIIPTPTICDKSNAIAKTITCIDNFKTTKASPSSIEPIQFLSEPANRQYRTSPSIFGSDFPENMDSQTVSHISATPESAKNFLFITDLPPPFPTPKPGFTNSEPLDIILPPPDF